MSYKRYVIEFTPTLLHRFKDLEHMLAVQRFLRKMSHEKEPRHLMTTLILRLRSHDAGRFENGDKCGGCKI